MVYVMSIIRVEYGREKYDFTLTLYPSFNYVFFEQVSRDKWVKRYGDIKLTLKVDRRGFIEVKCTDNSKLDYEYVLDITGLWFNPLEYYDKLPRSIRSKLERIIEVYSCLRLSINRVERDYILVSVALSRRTDFHRNTVRWCRRIFSTIKDIGDILGLNLESIATSYQVKQLNEILRGYLELKSVIDKYYSECNLASLRRTLLRIKWFGVKSTDAFILFSSRMTQSTPCDIHFQRFTKRLHLVDYKHIPSKSLCSKYYCDVCPHTSSCLYSLSIKYFKSLSGWIQTVAYVHDKEYCSKGRCLECPLRVECSLPTPHKL